MGGSSGATKTTGSSSNEIAPELQPLYEQTGGMVQGMQADIAPMFSQFFNPHAQNIPQPTAGQDNLNAQLARNAFGPSFNAPQDAAFGSLMTLANSPVGSSPQTIAAMQAARDPALNDLAMAGLGNSDAVGTSLGGAYAPILAQEMAQRFQAIPMLNQMGATQFGQQQQNLSAYGADEEQRRQMLASQRQADQADFLRLQGLGSQFTTGILGGFPAVSGTISSQKQTGGGK